MFEKYRGDLGIGIVRLKYLIQKTYETTHPYAGFASIEERLRNNSFLVVIDKGSFSGILTPSDDIESPHQLVIDCLHDKPRLDFEQDIQSALELMRESRSSVLPVFKEDEFVGVATQGVIMDYLFEYRSELEEAISERTTKLKAANEQLQAALEIKANELREVNSALRVLLKQREKDKTELEEKVLSNVKKLLVPHMERLKKSRLDVKQKAYLSVLESLLNDLISPFVRNLSLNYLNLTPTELQVAHLIKDGKTTKEIAELLNLSARTIEFHRQNIRTKIGIKNKKANLITHLLFMQNTSLSPVLTPH